MVLLLVPVLEKVLVLVPVLEEVLEEVLVLVLVLEEVLVLVLLHHHRHQVLVMSPIMPELPTICISSYILVLPCEYYSI